MQIPFLPTRWRTRSARLSHPPAILTDRKGEPTAKLEQASIYIDCEYGTDEYGFITQWGVRDLGEVGGGGGFPDCCHISVRLSIMHRVM